MEPWIVYPTEAFMAWAEAEALFGLAQSQAEDSRNWRNWKLIEYDIYIYNYIYIIIYIYIKLYLIIYIICIYKYIYVDKTR